MYITLYQLLLIMIKMTILSDVCVWVNRFKQVKHTNHPHWPNTNVYLMSLFFEEKGILYLPPIHKHFVMVVVSETYCKYKKSVPSKLHVLSQINTLMMNDDDNNNTNEISYILLKVYRGKKKKFKDFNSRQNQEITH